MTTFQCECGREKEGEEEGEKEGEEQDDGREGREEGEIPGRWSAPSHPCQEVLRELMESSLLPKRVQYVHLRRHLHLASTEHNHSKYQTGAFDWITKGGLQVCKHAEDVFGKYLKAR